MKKIEKYQADDGTEFSDQELCEKHEALCKSIAIIMERLPKLPENDGCKFANGDGYIQHEQAAFFDCKNALLDLAGDVVPHKWITKAREDTTQDIHPSWVARLLGDMSPPLSKAWYRFLCTDKWLREWGQPFYADNTPKELPPQIN